MRTTATLFAALLFSLVISAQPPVDTVSMYFDEPGEALSLDSLYPIGCWQVGHPNKSVFTSAYSEPHALVTDTLLPHMDSTTCYAEFSLVSIDDFHSRFVSFEHWVDMDSLATVGWIEVYDEWAATWRDLEHQINFWGGYLTFDFATWTDTMMIFTGGSNGWRHVEFLVDCAKIGPVPQHLRVRFAFRSPSNLSQRDGWMIDNVTATIPWCSGGIREVRTAAIELYPNPVDGSIRVALDMPIAQGMECQILRSDGRLIHREQRRFVDDENFDTRDLADGAYLVRLIGNGTTLQAPFIVQH